jgi:hypothetical protein
MRALCAPAAVAVVHRATDILSLLRGGKSAGTHTDATVQHSAHFPSRTSSAQKDGKRNARAQRKRTGSGSAARARALRKRTRSGQASTPYLRERGPKRTPVEQGSGKSTSLRSEEACGEPRRRRWPVRWRPVRQHPRPCELAASAMCVVCAAVASCRPRCERACVRVFHARSHRRRQDMPTRLVGMGVGFTTGTTRFISIALP